MDNTFDKVLTGIITEQSQIIGEKLSRARAENTGMITFQNESLDGIQVSGEPPEVLNSLVHSYGEIFGQASIDVCLDVLHDYPMDQIEQYLPNDLKSMLVN